MEFVQTVVVASIHTVVVASVHTVVVASVHIVVVAIGTYQAVTSSQVAGICRVVGTFQAVGTQVAS